MTQALYRKWRPQTWDEVVGQEHIIQTLRNAIQGGRIGHAYLFSGPRGTGKTTTARLLAKAVNCQAESTSERPCNTCEYCVAINDGRFLDLIEIDAASNTSVDDVRDLRDKINFSPNEGRYKVYIVDEVHMLSTAAFNALLKTLEEPPQHAIFILATTEVHKIPATVLSRCQRHEFRRLPVATIMTYLQPMIDHEGFNIDAEALEIIARQATGSLRDAISMLDQLTSTGDHVTLELAQTVLGTAAGEFVHEVVQALFAKDIGQGLTLINSALDGGADPRQFARQVVDYLRGMLLISMGNEKLVDTSSDVRGEMKQQVQGISPRALLAAIRCFSEAAVERSMGWQAGLPLEMALVQAANFDAPIRDTQLPPAPSGREQAAEPRVSTTEAKTPNPVSRADTAGYSVKDGGVSFEWLLDHWREVLAAARRRDARTQALLNSCRPLGLDAGVLVIGFRSDLLREKMEKGHNLTLAAQALQEVCGAPIGIRCVLSEAWNPQSLGDAPPTPMEDGGMVSTALRDLGGQVVNVENLPPDGS